MQDDPGKLPSGSMKGLQWVVMASSWASPSMTPCHAGEGLVLLLLTHRTSFHHQPSRPAGTAARASRSIPYMNFSLPTLEVMNSFPWSVMILGDPVLSLLGVISIPKAPAILHLVGRRRLPGEPTACPSVKTCVNAGNQARGRVPLPCRCWGAHHRPCGRNGTPGSVRLRHPSGRLSQSFHCMVAPVQASFLWPV